MVCDLQQLYSSSLVLCIGSPCSGLSILSQCLQLKGFKEPDAATVGPAIIHALLCRDLGISIQTAGSLPYGWQDAKSAQKARSRIRELLSKCIEKGGAWVLADSFLARVFPLWQDVLTELNIQPRLFHIIRHPWEVARSLTVKENMDLTVGHILWLSHLRDALRCCREQAHIQVTFDQLLADPLASLRPPGISHELEYVRETNRLNPDLLLNFIQPGLKHHHAGSISKADQQRFSAFIRLYDEYRLQQIATLSGGGRTAINEQENPWENEGLLETMCQALGHYEARAFERNSQMKACLTEIKKMPSLLATICVPVPEGTSIEKHFPIFSGQWQTLTVDIARPDLLGGRSLRVFPLNTMGIVTISDISIVDSVTHTRLWSIAAFNDSDRVIPNNSVLILPSDNCLSLFVMGIDPEIVFNIDDCLQDRPMRVEIRMRTDVNMETNHNALSVFLNRESWAVMLGTDFGVKSAETLIRLAEAFEKTGCLSEADVVFQKGLEIHPVSESLRIAYAKSAMKRRCWDEAIRRWQDVVSFLGENTSDGIYRLLNEAYQNQKLFPKGSSDEESHAGDGDKHEMLFQIHHILNPLLYLEIGVQEGKSFFLSRCRAIGVDPMPRVKSALRENAQIMTMTSDEFFKEPAEKLLRQPLDLVFIDGMHLFEYALRDFMNVERFAAPWTLVVIDDVFPVHPAQAERRRKTRTWTGDVWKLFCVLKKYRTDLFFLPINISPTGLLLIIGLDSE
ncbi:MAG: class I SAM-dependent methyltransferase, partial [Desulfobacteraceae bacterium]|nr:class I SAM-dependent methyltransferase [Desulfobacteraceae bacterium]